MNPIAGSVASSYSTVPAAAIDRSAAAGSTTTGSSATASASSSATNDQAATVDTIPSSPPDEVLDAIGTASKSYDSLAAQDKHVGFQFSEQSGRVVIQITDLQGNVIVPLLPPSNALSLADGKADS